MFYVPSLTRYRQVRWEKPRSAVHPRNVSYPPFI